MLSSLSDLNRKEQLLALKAERSKIAKKEMLHKLKLEIIPKLLMPGGPNYKIDLALEVDRKKVVIESLREMADTLEKGFS